MNALEKHVYILVYLHSFSAIHVLRLCADVPFVRSVQRRIAKWVVHFMLHIPNGPLTWEDR